MKRLHVKLLVSTFLLLLIFNSTSFAGEATKWDFSDCFCGSRRTAPRRFAVRPAHRAHRSGGKTVRFPCLPRCRHDWGCKTDPYERRETPCRRQARPCHMSYENWWSCPRRSGRVARRSHLGRSKRRGTGFEMPCKQ